MSFAQFRQAIREPRLAAVADHWDRACRGGAMPGWSDLDPIAIGRELPIVWSWRWDADIGDFVGRLAGDDIESVLGQSVRGRRLDQVFGALNAPIARCRYLEVMRRPAAVRSVGHVFGHVGGTGLGERIILPLAPDRGSGGGVFGATIYRVAVTGAVRTARIDGDAAERQVFPLVRCAPAQPVGIVMPPD